MKRENIVFKTVQVIFWVILGDLVTRIFSFHISMKFFRKFIETIQVIHKKKSYNIHNSHFKVDF